MSNTQVETVTTGADKAKLALSGVLVVGAIIAFYLLAKQDLWIRVLALVLTLVAAVGVFLTAEPGKALVAFGREAWRELHKVVWPTRSETLQMTGYVFAFVVLMALFLWATDKTLEWVIYELLLRWKQ